MTGRCPVPGDTWLEGRNTRNKLPEIQEQGVSEVVRLLPAILWRVGPQSYNHPTLMMMMKERVGDF